MYWIPFLKEANLFFVSFLIVSVSVFSWIHRTKDSRGPVASFGPVIKGEMSFIDISLFSSGDHFVQRTRAICAILVEGIMRNIQ